MVRTASLFSQILSEIPRVDFEKLVRRHGTERRSKGFTSWNQLVAMLFCHLAGADSLREICNGISCCLGKLVHLGVDRKPNKSTLAYANAHRNAALFEDLKTQHQGVRQVLVLSAFGLSETQQQQLAGVLTMNSALAKGYRKAAASQGLKRALSQS